MERRTEGRLPVDLPGSFKRAGETPQDMSFSQISSAGCRIRTMNAGFEAEEILELFLGPVGPVGASVIWVRDDIAGVRFDAPLDAAIVGYFVAFIKPF